MMDPIIRQWGPSNVCGLFARGEQPTHLPLANSEAVRIQLNTHIAFGRNGQKCDAMAAVPVKSAVSAFT